ncbi:LacI family DNA-binding transcriptional regulator [Nigerium massiliense]|uniref:LacI family DNA-binding transcriptional regulator n=1 Tax=Nigerium massiliense TaxID=1522317 RepID=UPI00058D5D20|nr:LacI family DNA-binding transcriptional regulator [Nigerium massiliense]
MQSRVTLADIARYTGLSTATVSMALNNAPGSRIPEATAMRVRQVADELGYVPNATARNLRAGRTATIGFLSDEVTVTRFASAMLRGILDVAEERDHMVMIMETDRRPERIADAVRSFKERGTDGLVVGLMVARQITLPSPQRPVPRVVINGTADGCLSILPDEFAGGYDAVRYLLERGHRRIALIGRHVTPPLPPISVTIGRRMEGIDRAMSDAGLSFVDEHRGAAWEPDLGYQGAREILSRTDDVTAVLAANDRIAFGVYQAAAERGLRIPDDLSVMSFDDEQLAGMLRPGLTTMRLPYREMGGLGATRVLETLSRGERTLPPGEQLLSMPLIERTSVRPA